MMKYTRVHARAHTHAHARTFEANLFMALPTAEKMAPLS